ncbi:sigma 54 modulation/S30EA ribosomal C-terminal domain-containing protein [Streptacidiphilus melanogenes]|uniref:sigma 54 modulation/S30EA ribosomal C-terminal domain-containing protein n=1 Tax=Streptacidiphilus melanogenes TaxID=411235 RepID=UPI000694397C|nr:sigma 54 modulation/S30EA ribosomal C-terminal domain-containing protein [Streptacidiphilus melanogenes]
MDRQDRPQALPELQVTVLGELSPVTSDLARSTVEEVLAESRQPVRSAQVRLARMRHKEGRAAVAQALVDVDGRLVRAQVAAHTMTDAIALLRTRLTAQLTRLEWARRWDPGYDADGSGPLDWRDGTEAVRRPVRQVLPKGERTVVRRKDYTLTVETVDQAALAMEMMDYDFSLFTESGSGQDSVVYRFGPGPFRLAQVEPQADRIAPTALPVSVLKTPAPVLTEDEARARLDATDYPFLFFKDAATGRGSVLYGRYDGHYGLISPVPSGVPATPATAGTAGGAAGTTAAPAAAPAAGTVTRAAASPPRPARPVGHDLEALRERVEVLEGQVTALAEVLDQLTGGLESVPGAPVDPEEVRRTARLARDMLLAAGFGR